MLFMAWDLRSLAPVRGGSVSSVLNFKNAQPRGEFVDQLVMLIRASFVLVVPDLKPVLRAGDMAQGWLQS
jgi:hypothetical protein